MTPEMIRALKNKSAAYPEHFRQFMYELAVEAVALMSEIRCELGCIEESQNDIVDLMKSQADPMQQAARQVAMMSGIPEVLALWNREHPLQRIEMQRPPKAPAGSVVKL